MWDEEKIRKWDSGAVRDSAEGKNRPDLIPVECLWRLGRLYEKGAVHYGVDNWKKGIPDESYIASLERHVMKYRMGLNDEDHLASAVFNIFGLMYNEIQRGEWHDDVVNARRTEE